MLKGSVPEVVRVRRLKVHTGQDVDTLTTFRSELEAEGGREAWRLRYQEVTLRESHDC